MQITIANSNGTEPQVLGDDAPETGLAWYIRDYKAVPTYDVRVSKRTRATNVTIWPRYNEQWAISFTVHTAFDDYADAIAYYHDHADTVPYQGVLTVTDHGTARAFPDAAKQTIIPVKLTGVSIDFDYRFLASINNPVAEP